MFSRLHRASLVVIIGLFLMSLMACGTAQSEPATCDDLPDILFFDDFNGEMDCGWATYNRGGGIAAIQNSSMQLKVSQPGGLVEKMVG